MASRFGHVAFIAVAPRGRRSRVFAGTERGSRLCKSRSIPLWSGARSRIRAAVRSAPRASLTAFANIIERGVGVPAERLRVIPLHPERNLMISPTTRRAKSLCAATCFFQRLQIDKGQRVVGCCNGCSVKFSSPWSLKRRIRRLVAYSRPLPPSHHIIRACKIALHGENASSWCAGGTALWTTQPLARTTRPRSGLHKINRSQATSLPCPNLVRLSCPTYVFQHAHPSAHRTTP